MTEPPYKPAGATHLADDRADDAAGGVFARRNYLLGIANGSCSLAAGPGGAVLAQAPYGIDAECVMPVEVRRAARPAAETDWPRALRNRGYDGI